MYETKVEIYLPNNNIKTDRWSRPRLKGERRRRVRLWGEWKQMVDMAGQVGGAAQPACMSSLSQRFSSVGIIWNFTVGHSPKAETCIMQNVVWTHSGHSDYCLNEANSKDSAYFNNSY